jgi:hypothetical protein
MTSIQSDSADSTPYCADVARASAATQAGSAARADVWLLLEYTQSWRAEAVTDNDLATPVKEWLAAQAVANGRVLFIRQFGRNPDLDGIAFYVAVSAESDQRLYRFTLNAYEELTKIDMQRLRDGTAYGDQTSSDQLTLVCTNGKRDRCCSRYGAALYRALLEKDAPHVWQSTHLDGHRFAAVAAWFPEGAYFGLLDPEDCDTFMHARANGDIVLSRYRGRTFYNGEIQSADYFLRRELNLTHVDAVRHVETVQTEPNTWHVHLAVADSEYVVDVRGELNDTVLASCSPPKNKPSVSYRFLAQRRLR